MRFSSKVEIKTAAWYLELFGSMNENKTLKYKIIFFKDNVIIVNLSKMVVKIIYGLTNLTCGLWLTKTHESRSISQCFKYLCSSGGGSNSIINYNKTIIFLKYSR